MNNGNEKINKANFKKEFKRKVYFFVLKLITFVDKLDKKDQTCREISEQGIDSGTGILSNYLEKQVSSSKRDFAKYFHHSLKSVNQTTTWIAVLRDSKKADINPDNNLLKELDEISRIFASSLITIKNK